MTRPCTFRREVEEVKGYYTYIYVTGEWHARGQESDGEIATPVGIVELPDGIVETVTAHRIRFTDKEER